MTPTFTFPYQFLSISPLLLLLMFAFFLPFFLVVLLLTKLLSILSRFSQCLLCFCLCFLTLSNGFCLCFSFGDLHSFLCCCFSQSCHLINFGLFFRLEHQFEFC